MKSLVFIINKIHKNITILKHINMSFDIDKIIKKCRDDNNEFNYPCVIIIYHMQLKETCEEIISIKSKNNLFMCDNENKHYTSYLCNQMDRIIAYLKINYRSGEMINAVFIIGNTKIIEEQLDLYCLRKLIKSNHIKISCIAWFLTDKKNNSPFEQLKKLLS